MSTINKKKPRTCSWCKTAGHTAAKCTAAGAENHRRLLAEKRKRRKRASPTEEQNPWQLALYRTLLKRTKDLLQANGVHIESDVETKIYDESKGAMRLLPPNEFALYGYYSNAYSEFDAYEEARLRDPRRSTEDYIYPEWLTDVHFGEIIRSCENVLVKVFPGIKVEEKFTITCTFCENCANDGGADPFELRIKFTPAGFEWGLSGFPLPESPRPPASPSRKRPRTEPDCLDIATIRMLYRGGYLPEVSLNALVADKKLRKTDLAEINK